MKRVNINVDYMQMFVTLSNAGTKINADAKKLIDKVACDKGIIWNRSNCECECGKLCHIVK